MTTRPPLEERVLILAPTAKDGRISQAILAESGVSSTPCSTLDELCTALDEGAGAVVLSEEALRRGGLSRLAEAVSRQPAWSDFPFLVLTGEGADSELALRTVEMLGNVTLLERPVRVPALVSAVREADRRKDEFLAILAHELRNPLAPLRNSLETMRLSGDDPQTTRLARGIMQRQVDQMVRLIDDLLDVSRVSRGKITLSRDTLELRSIVMDALEACRPLIATSSHELTVSLPDQPVRIEGDRTRLVQVLCNLLSNASKYTSPGGRIALEARAEGGEVLICVSDSGVGTPADLVAPVFYRSAQAQGPPARSQGGLGIGLTLVKRLVELHGGSVEAQSEGSWRGSRFIVRLPRALKVTSLPPAPRPAAPKGRLRPHRILVADDNRDAADSLATMLRLGGHEVGVAYDGREALALAQTFQPEVALLDIGMPRMNGYETAQALRSRTGAAPRTPNLLLFALSGWGQPDDKRRSRASGFDHHFVKPLDPAEFERILAEKNWTAPGEATA